MTTMELRRVPYGKQDTAKELREYTITGQGQAVGTIDEILIFLLSNKITGTLMIKELDGTYRVKPIKAEE